ncbi:MAG: DUF952 domain-containing protein [Chitinophagaceae bacterium]|nr:DUF952 domain-containing protein [Chitinophagaceae bacterium]
MPIIYHVTTAEAWKEAQQNGFYEAASLKEEGYIHCSLEKQVAGVLDRYFQGKDNLVKLVIDTDKLTSQYIYDWSTTNEDTFPHIYGPINLDAVNEVLVIR